MAALTIGVLMVMERENLEVRSTSRGKTSEYEGSKRTSSNVNPSKTTFSERNDMYFCFNVFINAQNYKKIVYWYGIISRIERFEQ